VSADESPGDESSADDPPVSAVPSKSGADLAREALARAKSGKSAIAGAGKSGAAQRRRIAGDRARGSGWSGAGPDDRDPQMVGSTIRDLVDGRGWQRTTQVATVLSCWEQIVGDAIAAHCQPEAVNDGELVLSAESTSWATQLRMLVPTMIARVDEQLGKGVVTAIRVHGPTGPAWRHGPRRVAGRGPRDTYG
jgi:predicted nucleic acid-binding Zn ribbon protein